MNDFNRCEHRNLGKGVKFKTRAENDKLFISGYFSVFNSNYELWPGATESIDPHTFDNEITSDIRCLIDHDTRLVLGRTKAGTLVLKIDTRGLWGEIEINQKDQDAINLYERVKRGDVDQCSFGFEIKNEEFTDNGDGTVHWLIKEVKLYEVSVVTFPAYEDTGINARKNDLKQIAKRGIEALKNDLKKHLKGER